MTNTPFPSKPSNLFAIPPVVLVVDDSSDTLNQLCESIAASGCIAIPVRNAEEALKSLEFSTPDAVLLDATSPEIKGFELGRRIKSMPIWEHIPILFMVELANTAQIIASFENGGVDYIPKPLRITEVITRLLTRIVIQIYAKHE
ncbi:MAG: response regulator [Azoarcus sp.]|nr:response regulator [Azoarcus sp.]